MPSRRLDYLLRPSRHLPEGNQVNWQSPCTNPYKVCQPQRSLSHPFNLRAEISCTVSFPHFLPKCWNELSIFHFVHSVWRQQYFIKNSWDDPYNNENSFASYIPACIPSASLMNFVIRVYLRGNGGWCTWVSRAGYEKVVVFV